MDARVPSRCWQLYSLARQRQRSLFALNAILPLAGILCENLKQVSILGNSWDKFSLERLVVSRGGKRCAQCPAHFTGKRASASVQLRAFSPHEFHLIVE